MPEPVLSPTLRPARQCITALQATLAVLHGLQTALEVPLDQDRLSTDAPVVEAVLHRLSSVREALTRANEELEGIDAVHAALADLDLAPFRINKIELQRVGGVDVIHIPGPAGEGE